MNTTTAKKSTATRKPAAATKAPAKKAPAKAPVKAAAKKAPAKAAAPVKKAPAKKAPAPLKLTTLSGVSHPAVRWSGIVEASGLSVAELERNAGVPLGSVYRVIRHGVLPSATLTVRFAAATEQKAETLWAEVSSFSLAEAQAEVKKADAKKK
jgi:hypothetical protein